MPSTQENEEKKQAVWQDFMNHQSYDSGSFDEDVEWEDAWECPYFVFTAVSFGGFAHFEHDRVDLPGYS